MAKTPLKTMKIRLTDAQVKTLRRESNGFVWTERKSTMAVLVRLGIVNSPGGITSGHLTVVGTGLAASVQDAPRERRTYEIVTPESAAQWEAEAEAVAATETATDAVEALTEDITAPATMFDPELTYYADGTRVLMTWSGGVKEGTTFGWYVGAGPYAFQAVRWDDGSADGVAPHTLSRVDPEEKADVLRRRIVAHVDLTAPGKGIVLVTGTDHQESPQGLLGRQDNRWYIQDADSDRTSFGDTKDQVVRRYLRNQLGLDANAVKIEYDREY